MLRKIRRKGRMILFALVIMVMFHIILTVLLAVVPALALALLAYEVVRSTWSTLRLEARSTARDLSKIFRNAGVAYVAAARGLITGIRNA